MSRSNSLPGINPGHTRREALGLFGAGVGLLGAGVMSRPALAQGDDVLTEALVLRDPDVPATGNLQGDINIVEWFDYNCPYCRKIAPEISQVVQDDGKVRMVLKDWPILGEVSKFGARMALAAKYQDKYMPAHEAMIGVSSKLTEPRIRELLDGAGIDMDRLNRDAATNAKAIDTILARNHDQASSLRIQGNAVIHRRQVPRAGNPVHGGIRIGDRRRPQGEKGQLAITPEKTPS